MQYAIDRYDIHKFYIGEGLGSPILRAAAQGKWRQNCKWNGRCGRGHRGGEQAATCDTSDSKKDQSDYCGQCEYGWRRPNWNLNDWCCTVRDLRTSSDCKCQEEYALECKQAISTAGEKSNIYSIVPDELICISIFLNFNLYILQKDFKVKMARKVRSEAMNLELKTVAMEWEEVMDQDMMVVLLKWQARWTEALDTEPEKLLMELEEDMDQEMEELAMEWEVCSAQA